MGGWGGRAESRGGGGGGEGREGGGQGGGGGGEKKRVEGGWGGEERVVACTCRARRFNASRAAAASAPGSRRMCSCSNAHGVRMVALRDFD